MSVASRVFKGYGNGTVAGTVTERVHRGYTAGVALVMVGYLFTESTISYAAGLNSSVGYNVNIEAIIK